MARKNGFTIYTGSPTTLLLDIDDDESLKHYTSMLKSVQQVLSVSETTRWKSKSGNTHIVLELSKELDVTARIALQMVLGSDRKRGLYELLHVILGANPIALFKPKETK
jgi:hypothetical protein